MRGTDRDEEETRGKAADTYYAILALNCDHGDLLCLRVLHIGIGYPRVLILGPEVHSLRCLLAEDGGGGG